ncbi:MAG: hypothetical protein WCK91_03160 [bacterium]
MKWITEQMAGVTTIPKIGNPSAGEGAEEVGKVSDDLQRLYAVAHDLEVSYQGMIREARSGRKTKLITDKIVEAEAVHAKYHAVLDFFMASVKEEYGLWGCRFAITEDWTIFKAVSAKP